MLPTSWSGTALAGCGFSRHQLTKRGSESSNSLSPARTMSSSFSDPAARTTQCTRRTRPSRSFVPGREVPRLLLRQRVDVDTHRLELEPRDLAVDLRRHRIDLAVELACVASCVLERERLVREGHVHH